ncbi:MAG TPA: AGE family epimerase/isomerase [Anaerolineae bacterium]|nr:AGE family epimerase/isomerase [Anaerolineae bacterium]HOR01409.1 AGE family epimerase/isomerase [Anaerolineae bacterium]HPL28440.1 AGE family epimerase/isomerase [Anaerolineae bacterium]
MATKAATPSVGVVSPQDRGLPVAQGVSEELIPELGVSPAELERRLRANTYQWLPTQFDEPSGAFRGHYCAVQQTYEPPQTSNLIGPWQLLAVYDHNHDELLLTRARRAADWFQGQHVVSHPMEVVIGGVRDSRRPEELWTKYAAEYVILSVALYRRLGESQYLDRAFQSSEFLIQSMWHNYAPRYDEKIRAWEEKGWHSFGRIVEAFLEMSQLTGDRVWLERALQTGEHGLTLQAPNGGFYLMDGEYFNTDLAADELRALVLLSQWTGEGKYLNSARRFADWLLTWQRDDGAWPLTIDRHDNVVVATVGPGDMANVGMALLYLHEVSPNERYRQAALRAQRFALSTQVLPNSDDHFSKDLRALWGFWSWHPRYDYTLSVDQSTHHVRGMLFLLDLEAHHKLELSRIIEV